MERFVGVWYSVKKGLPGIGKWVLVANDDNHVTQAVLNMNNKAIYWNQSEPLVDGISWWMYIPDIPKGEQE